MTPLVPVAVVCVLSAATAPAQDWPSFRGPGSNGVSAAAAAPPVSGNLLVVRTGTQLVGIR